MFKGIQQKILYSFVTMLIVLLATISIILVWRLNVSINRQSEEVATESLKQSQAQIAGDLSIVSTLYDNLKQDVGRFTANLSKNTMVSGNIENQQLESLNNLLAEACKSANIDFAVIYDNAGVFQAAFPANGKDAAQAKSMAPYQKIISQTKEKTGFFQHPSEFVDAFDFSKRVSGGAKAVSLTSGAAILDDFGDPMGYLMAGKLLNGYNDIFQQLHAATGSNGLLFQNEKAISAGGFGKKNTSMTIAAETAEKVAAAKKPLQFNLPLLDHNFLMSCAAVTDLTGQSSAAICVGEDEQDILRLKDNLVAAGARTKNSIMSWLASVSVSSLLIFIVVIFFLAASIKKPLAGISIKLANDADDIARGAKEISGASQSLSNGAAGQAASVEETSASMEELYSMTRQNAENAEQVDGLMRNMKDITNQTSGNMSEVNSAIEEISQASEETYKIIKTIDEIAFQTNLLALNAAVEAARSGEAGAGFAVVADEVRSLAQRSTKAAHDTSELISGTVQKIKDGKALIDTTANNFSEVSDNVVKVSTLITEIASASHEQFTGFDQVNKAITEIESVTQQNSALAEETTAGATEFTQKASELTNVVHELEDLVGGKSEISSTHDNLTPQIETFQS